MSRARLPIPPLRRMQVRVYLTIYQGSRDSFHETRNYRTPQSGKTTLFNALTRAMQPTGVTGKIEVHTAVVDVPDVRVDRLSGMFNPKKTIYAKVTYADIAGLDGSASKGGISGALLNQLDPDGRIYRCGAGLRR